MPDTAFVSMPFGDKPENLENEWTKLFTYGLKPLEGELKDLPDNIKHTPVKLWRADVNLGSLNLKYSVMRGIEQSTFVICVLTTLVAQGKKNLRLTNPNVLWELGYAEALGKPIIVMADDSDLSQLPVLTGNPNVCIYNHKIVKEVNSKDAKSVLRVIAQNLVPYISLASEEARKGHLGYSNKTRAVAYSKRDAIDLSDLIGTANNQIDILTTNLNYFQFDKLKGKENPLIKALENDVAVRIVTMDPESVIAEYRAKQLIRGQDIPGYRKELREGIINLYDKLGDYPQFYLHIYNDLPLQITFRIDETIITSIVTRGERSRKRIQVQFNLYDEGVTESFVAHFQTMFDSSLDVRGLRWVTEFAPRIQNQKINTDRILDEKKKLKISKKHKEKEKLIHS